MSKRYAFVAAILAMLGFVPAASGEEFPSRPITWIVPFTPGGITDTNSRIVAEELSRSLGQSVLIDNRGGAGGTVGTEQAARARAGRLHVDLCDAGHDGGKCLAPEKPALRSAAQLCPGSSCWPKRRISSLRSMERRSTRCRS